MPTETITPTAAAEKLGEIIGVDRLDTDKILFTFVNEVDQEVDVKVYGSNYNDSTMDEKVLLTTIVMADGSVTPTTAGYQDDNNYHYYRVGVTPAALPTGDFTNTWDVEEKLI